MSDATRYPEVERRSNLSIRDFKKEYLKPGKPVVITDAIEDWNARSRWTFDFFKDQCRSDQVVAYEYKGGKYRPADERRMPFADYIEGVVRGDSNSFPYYIRDNWAILEKHPELSADYRCPEYFFDWFQFLPSFMRLKYPRIFLGPKGAITPLHVDIWGTHAWLSQLVGRKRWILFPPNQSHLLYNYDFDPGQPDFDRFPLSRQAQASALECTVGPGDTVFVPSNWSHWVISLDPAISLSANFMAPGCMWLPLRNATQELVLKRFWSMVVGERSLSTANS